MLEWSTTPDWEPPIVETIATDGVGIDTLWDAVRVSTK